MKRWPGLLLAALVPLLLLIPATVLAAETTGNDDFMLKVGGTTTVEPREVIDSVIVINGDAIVAGTVTSTLWVIGGTATVSGHVNGDVMVVNGVLSLTSSATVKNAALVSSELAREPGATVTGELTEQVAFVHFGWGSAVFSMLFWIFTTAALLVAWLIVATVAGRRLSITGHEVTEQAGASLLTALIVWVGLPIVAVLAAITLIGIPVALAIAVLVMPVLWITGYVVAGVRLGEYLVGEVAKRPTDPERPYLHVTIGLLTFQLVGLIPFAGGLVVGLAGFAGSGALVYRLFRHRGQRERIVVQQPTVSAA